MTCVRNAHRVPPAVSFERTLVWWSIPMHHPCNLSRSLTRGNGSSQLQNPMTSFRLCAMTALFLLAAITRAQGLQGEDGTCDAGDSACEVANAKEEAFFNTYSSPEAQANSTSC